MCIPDQPDVYRMVPAWIFFGDKELYLKEGGPKLQKSKEDKSFPYAIINAIDGSIIDISKEHR